MTVDIFEMRKDGKPETDHVALRFVGDIDDVKRKSSVPVYWTYLDNVYSGFVTSEPKLHLFLGQMTPEGRQNFAGLLRGFMAKTKGMPFILFDHKSGSRLTVARADRSSSEFFVLSR